jgi:hypothetical protein
MDDLTILWGTAILMVIGFAASAMLFAINAHWHSKVNRRLDDAELEILALKFPHRERP